MGITKMVTTISTPDFSSLSAAGTPTPLTSTPTQAAISNAKPPAIVFDPNAIFSAAAQPKPNLTFTASAAGTMSAAAGISSGVEESSDAKIKRLEERISTLTEAIDSFERMRLTLSEYEKTFDMQALICSNEFLKRFSPSNLVQGVYIYFPSHFNYRFVRYFKTGLECIPIVTIRKKDTQDSLRTLRVIDLSKELNYVLLCQVNLKDVTDDSIVFDSRNNEIPLVTATKKPLKIILNQDGSYVLYDESEPLSALASTVATGSTTPLGAAATAASVLPATLGQGPISLSDEKNCF